MTEQPELPKSAYPYNFSPILITVTPEVQELLNSKEAKFYLGHIKKWSLKLHALFDRECKGNAIHGALETHEYIQKLEKFLDDNVPTWRSELGEADTGGSQKTEGS